MNAVLELKQTENNGVLRKEASIKKKASREDGMITRYEFGLISSVLANMGFQRLHPITILYRIQCCMFFPRQAN